MSGNPRYVVVWSKGCVSTIAKVSGDGRYVLVWYKGVLGRVFAYVGTFDIV